MNKPVDGVLLGVSGAWWSATPQNFKVFGLGGGIETQRLERKNLERRELDDHRFFL